jgi:GTPase SAR1 family protein
LEQENRFNFTVFKRTNFYVSYTTIIPAYSSIKVNIELKTIELNLCITAGQEAYRLLIPQYARGTYDVILVFDLTSKDSFESLSNWVEFIQQYLLVLKFLFWK